MEGSTKARFMLVADAIEVVVLDVSYDLLSLHNSKVGASIIYDFCYILLSS